MSHLTTDDLRRLGRMRELCASGQARVVRENARITRAEMARALGVTWVTVERWEKGAPPQNADMALKWLKILDDLAPGLW